MDGLTTVRVVFALPRKRKRSATTFMPTWTALVGQAQAELTSQTPLPAQSLMATASRWVILILMVETVIFSELLLEILRPITCRRRREAILSQAKLQPATVTTAHSRWTSFAAE